MRAFRHSRRRPPFHRTGALVFAALASISGPVRPDGQKPSDVVEHVTVRLEQIDVSVSGPRAHIETLARSDFRVRIGGKALEDFTVDRVCAERSDERVAASPRPVTAAPDNRPPNAEVRRGVATYVFYFDHAHMTLAGRAEAIERAEALVPKLLAHGDRAMILSNAQKLTTYLRLTDDVSAVIAALDRLASDHDEFDPYAAEEDARVDSLLSALNEPTMKAPPPPRPPRPHGIPGRGGGASAGSGGSSFSGSGGSFGSLDSTDPDLDKPNDPASAAMRSFRIAQIRGLATAYAYEERWRQERDLRRLEMAMSRLADLDAPKALLYFADTMRANPGEHYLALLGQAAYETPDRRLENDAATARVNLDRVIERADALGIRFYTVEAGGLHGESLHLTGRYAGVGGENAAGPPPAANYQRHRDAQDTLASMALETGGQAFLNGGPTGRMADRILDDLSCIYVISFDPRSFPQDVPLKVDVSIARPGYKARTRQQLVIMGASTRQTARLLASFTAPEAVNSDVPLHLSLIPTGIGQGRFHSRVQVEVPPTGIAGATWDIGVSLLSQGMVSQEFSKRVTIDDGSVPIVLELDATFAPGPYEIVAVAHEATSDQIAARQIDGNWPALGDSDAHVGPVAVVQPAGAVFVRGDGRRTSGNLALVEEETARRESPTAIIGVVCRSKDGKHPIRVDRELIGEGSTPLEPAVIPYDPEEPCAQFRDLIPPNTLGEGRFRYVVRVSDGAKELARTERVFEVGAGR